MDSLPSSLLYYTSQIANFTRNTVKVNSLNQTSLSSNGVSQIRLALPVNSVLNMKSLSMHGTVSTTQGATQGTPASVLIPRGGIGALLDRVTWSAGGIALDNGPVPYHVISALKANLEKSNDKNMSDDRVLQQAEIQDKSSSVNPSDDQGQQKQLIQNNFLGFTECHPAYLDMSLLPECFMTIQCAQASVCPLQSNVPGATLGDAVVNDNVGTPAFSIDNIFFTVEVCQIGSGMYDALTQRLLMERGSVDVPYPQYQVFSTIAPSGVGEVRGSVSCMSLDRIYAVARNNGSTEGAGATTPAGFAQSQAPVTIGDAVGCKFQQQAVNFAAFDTKSWKFQLNNAPMPLYNADRIDAYNYAVCAEDRTYSANRGSLVHSQDAWLGNKWCACQRLNLDNDPTRLSGVNLSSINAQIVYSPTGGDSDPRPPVDTAGGVQMMLITKQTSVLRIGQSRACAVVA